MLERSDLTDLCLYPGSCSVWQASWHVSRGAQRTMRRMNLMGWGMLDCVGMSSISSKAGSKNITSYTPVQDGMLSCSVSSSKSHKTWGFKWVCSFLRLDSPQTVPETVFQWQQTFWGSKRNIDVREGKWERKEKAYRMYYWTNFCEQPELSPAGDCWKVWSLAGIYSSHVAARELEFVFTKPDLSFVQGCSQGC